MKEAYSKGIQWTRTFVTGPFDPEHNKHKFYCQICTTNVSIFTKGAREIVRHFQSESHFRKDWRWRFEYFKKKDRVTGREIHEAIVKNGQILTPSELEKEKPIFMEAPLVETGCSYPFYDEYMAGLGSVVSQEEIRLCVQISMVAPSLLPALGTCMSSNPCRLRSTLWLITKLCSLPTTGVPVHWL